MNKYRIGTDIPFRLSINDSGVMLDWSATTVRKVAMYSDDREAFAGACTHVVDGEDATLLDCIYPASEQLFTGALRVVVIFDTAEGRTLTYDLADVFALVATSEEADSDGDTVTDATVTASGLPISTVSLILNACIAATEAAGGSVISEVSYTESTQDAGSNILHIEQADGTEHDFPIRNGSKGSTGDPGVGIASVEQTTTGDGDGAINIMTVTKTDGTTSTFQVKNGSRGPQGLQGGQGEQGNSGYTGAADELEVVNNDTDGGPAAAWSAARGKAIREDVGESVVSTAYEDMDLGTLATGSIRCSSGRNATGSDKHRTGYRDISAYAGKTIRYSRQHTTEESSTLGLAFYDSSQGYISGEAWIAGAETAYLEETEIAVPATAAFVRFCWFMDFDDDACLKVPVTTKTFSSGIGKEVDGLRTEMDAVQADVYQDVDTPVDVTSGKVYTLEVGSAPSMENYTTYKCIAVTGLAKGDRVAFHGYAGNSYRTWGKAKSGIVTEVSGKGIEVNTTVECDGTFDAIYINAYNSYLNPPTASIITKQNAFDYANELVAGLGIPDRKTVNILCFGNSFTQGSFGYVPAILKRLLPDIDFTIDMAVIGASPLAQHLAYMTGTEQVLSDYTYRVNPTTGKYERISNATGTVTTYDGYTLLESVAGGKWQTASAAALIPDILARQDWDIVTFQQRGASDGNDYDTSYAPYIYKLHLALAEQMGHRVQLSWNMTHGTYKSTKAARLADWENIVVNAQKVMELTASDLLLPYGTAVQNLRTTSLDLLGDYEYGGAMQVDEGHLQQGIGCLAAGYAVALAFVKALGYGTVGIIGDDLRPDADWLSAIGVNWNIGTGVIGITDDNCILAQIAATKALSNPYELTDISAYENAES